MSGLSLLDVITVATSIVPRDITNQRQALNSWIKVGFKVISFNSADECEVLKPLFEDIEFIEIDRDARHIMGKPFVYFDDIMNYFKKCHGTICGIINSDIHLIGIDNKFIPYIKEQAKNALVFGSRMDIESIDNLNGIMLENGYDYFFFDRKLADFYPKEDFLIGQPAWDYWMVIIPIINNFKVKRIMCTIAYHIIHMQHWSMETSINNIRHIIDNYLKKNNYHKCIIEYTDPFNYFKKLLWDYPERIFYYTYNTEKKIVVVYNKENDINIQKSETYKSIETQSYPNYRVIVKQKDADISHLVEDEEYLCFVDEGYILDRNYLLFLVNSSEEYDCIMCGIRLYEKGSYIFSDIFPYDFRDKKIKSTIVLDVCRLIKVSLKENIQQELFEINHVGFVGRALVSLSFDNYLSKRLKGKKGKRFLVYGAGQHTLDLFKGGYLDNSNICGITDADERLKGKKIQGISISNINSICDVRFDYIIISSKAFEGEIFNNLSKIIDEDKIIRIYSR